MLVEHTERLPIKIWSHAIDPNDGVMTQARNLANHPIARKWVCLMPDFHLGYGMPIGGVVATKGGVIPNAVGVDIGCGMIAARTDLDAAALSIDALQALREAIHTRVPVGMKHHAESQGESALPDKIDDPIIEREWQAAQFQVGTLGGGNHFIEIQRDDEGRVWIMLHSGSRNVGKRVCDHYHGIAKSYMERFYSAIPDIDLSFLPDSVPEYGAYMAAMRWCMTFAEASRARMFDQTVEAFASLGHRLAFDLAVDTHHNFAAMENHAGENLLIHRKGAVKAEGLVTIPGSMGTASYIGRGLASKESFNTCSHGAGRVLGRKEANRTISAARARESMAHVVFGVRDGDFDEMPDCYKDIEQVMTNQVDLVEPVHRLLPLAVVKG